MDPLSLILHRHNLGDPGYLVLPTPYAWSEALAKKEQTPETSALPETDLCKRSIILFRFWTGIALYCDMEFPLRESSLGVKLSPLARPCAGRIVMLLQTFGSPVQTEARLSRAARHSSAVTLSVTRKKSRREIEAERKWKNLCRIRV